MTDHVMIIGATGSGKTKIAFELARRRKGEIVNLDRAYLYRGFRIATGLQDAIKEHGVKRHLYELLDPIEPSFPPAQFIQLVEHTVKQVESFNRLAIAEGGSTQYIPALLEQNSQRKIFKHVLGIRCHLTDEHIQKYILRIEQAVDDGLVQEIAANMKAYQESFLIQECHGAIPIVKYLEGRISLQQAKTEILERSLAYKTRQSAMFERLPGVQWIDSENTEDAVRAVESLI